MKTNRIKFSFNYIIFLVLAIFVIGASGLFSQASLVEKKEKSDFERKHFIESKREAVTIQKVLNNVTVQVYKNNWDKKIELIGIELPEWSKIEPLFNGTLLAGENKEDYRRVYSKAFAAIKQYVSPGDVLYIEQDIRKQNAFGSLLVYLYSPDRRIINIELVRQGLAMPINDPDNKVYHGEFVKALDEAIQMRRGLYKIWELRRNNKW